MKHYSIASKLLLSTALIGMSTVAVAQDAADDEIIVVGTQIKGSDIAGILPVTSLSIADIEVTGAVSGDELLASIPQLGDVSFREGRFSGVNGARGDVGSINLRGVGTGNTLVLLNGRRLVLHPGTQAEDLVPVVSVNSNALPVTGVKRLEVLRDGASAVYGTDAVAGVVNTILEDNYDGLQVNLQFGASEGTSLSETSATAKWGKNFNGGKTNISLFGNMMLRNGMPATDLRNSSTEDLRTFFVGTPFEGDTQLRNLSSQTQFGEFRSLEGRLDVFGDDDFHIQPDTLSGCLLDLAGGVCADNGGSIDTSLRLDRARFRDIVGDTDRYNLFAFGNHELDNGMELFGEASYYHADYSRRRESAAILSSNRFAVAADAFYNPVGVDVQIRDYRPIDTGQREISVKNDSFRVLGGLRGNWGDWDWETAGLYSRAETKDRTNRISNTLFQQAINRTDASAYNIFSGGNIGDTNAPNLVNDQATIDSFIVDVKRDGTTELALIDAKISTPSLFSLPGGDVGVAIGAEWRNESFADDRDDRLDGSITFTDSVTGGTNLSDVLGSSPSPDTNGSRDVLSAFVEFAVPLVNEEMNIPLVHSFDIQLAARAESFSDVGDVVKPKIAASWHLFPQLSVRGSYSEGFRAPNLEQINANGVRRVNGGREDWILCEAISRANNTPFNVGDCDGNSVESVRSGGPELEPEENKNFSVGAVLEPFDGLTFTADWWRIEQEDIVGIFGDQNQISLDYLLRLQGGSNPNVIREAPDADTTAIFTAAGLDPVGDVIEVRDAYTNLFPRDIQGLDFGAYYTFDVGDSTFNLKANAAYLDEFFQTPSPLGQSILDGVADGTLNSAVDVPSSQDLIQQNRRPEWRWTGSVVWDHNSWGAGAFYRYVGDVVDTSTNNSEFDALPVDSFKTLSLYGDYTWEGEEYGIFDDVRLRLGVRNVGNKKPPLADEFARGYFVGLHSNRGRYWYTSVRKTF